MKLALGTVQFGMDYGIQGGRQPAEEAVESILSDALRQGITHFDTASAYGNAEMVLGRYRKKHPQPTQAMRLVSKLPPQALVQKPKAIWKDLVLQEIDESLERLQTTGLEAYLFHNAESLFQENAVRAFYEACRERPIKKIGVSIYTPKEARKALSYEEIRVIQIPYNVFDRRLDQSGFFEQAKKQGVKIYARSSLLQGLLLMDPEQLPNSVRFAKGYLEKFRSICRDYKVSPLQAAVGYAGAHDGIDFVLFGVDNQKQLAEYVSLQNEKLPPEMIQTLQKEFEEVEERLVNPALWK